MFYIFLNKLLFTLNILCAFSHTFVYIFWCIYIWCRVCIYECIFFGAVWAAITGRRQPFSPSHSPPSPPTNILQIFSEYSFSKYFRPLCDAYIYKVNHEKILRISSQRNQCHCKKIPLQLRKNGAKIPRKCLNVFYGWHWKTNELLRKEEKNLYCRGHTKT